MRIYFAGGGFDHIPDMIGHPWRLNSILEVNPKLGATLAARDPETVIIDSGLFSFMFGSKQGEIAPTFEAYRDYTRRYLDTLDGYGYRGMLVECDTHKLLGMESTHRLREEFKPLGDRVIYTWHAPEGIDGLVKLATEKSYIALSVPELRILGGGTAKSGKTESVFRLLHHIREKVGPKNYPRIHLLGCTIPRLMETSLAWSCDSTSWIATSMYGVGFMHHTPGKLERCEAIRGSTRNRAPSARAQDRANRFDRWCEIVQSRYHLSVEPMTGKRRTNDLQMLATAVAFGDYQQWLDKKITPHPVKEYRL